MLSSHPLVAAVARRLTNATATLSHPHTGKCPTSFPHNENTRRRVNTSGLPNLTSSFPSEGAIFFPDLQAKNSCSISQSHRILAHQTVIRKVLSYTRCRGQTFINEDIINIQKRHIDSLPPPRSQLMCAHFCIGSESIHKVVQFAVIEYRTHLLFLLLHDCHQRNQTLWGSQSFLGDLVAKLNWRVFLGPFPPGGPHSLVGIEGDVEIRLTNAKGCTHLSSFTQFHISGWRDHHAS
ncbi:unnamed protein product [Acanthosepion pharaonis]|uniref:Uncharacterized protein n=1 Tax=Acanthosepion pharaonis TaxID=158019 RepID=A0A812DQK8_ACAPH|nr:unnamed protein product [Sepia pharaonis]